MNKKGFTLIELLAVLVIIGLMGGIALVSYSSYVRSSRDRVFKSYIDTMHAEAVYYLSNNSNLLPANGDWKTIYLEDLPIDPFNNPDNINDTCINSNSYVKVTRSDAGNVISLTYTVCLKCNSGYNHCETYEN